MMSGLVVSNVFYSKNGVEALGVLEENWIDLALVDINMPVMDGETLITAIRANADLSELPIIVISTESSETRIARLREYGVGFVHKPFKPEEIQIALNVISGGENEESTFAVGGQDF